MARPAGVLSTAPDNWRARVDRELHPVAGMPVGLHRVVAAVEPIGHDVTVNDLLPDAVVDDLATLHGNVARALVAHGALMRDGATRDGAEHGQRIAIVAATELPADRRTDDAAGGRDSQPHRRDVRAHARPRPNTVRAGD